MRHQIKKDGVNTLVDKGRVSGSRKIQEFGLGDGGREEVGTKDA
mgnify:CR=1 FL=1